MTLQQNFRHICIRMMGGDNGRLSAMGPVYNRKDFCLQQVSNPGPLNQEAGPKPNELPSSEWKELMYKTRTDNGACISF